MVKANQILVGVLCFMTGFGDAFAQTVRVELKEAVNVRKKSDNDLLIQESTLPAGSVIEVSAEQLRSAAKYSFWRDEDKQAPINFIKGVKVVTAPGFSKEEVEDLNKLNRSSSLFISKQHVDESRVVRSNPSGRTVALNKPADVFTNDNVPLPPQRPKNLGITNAAADRDVVEQLENVRGATRDAGTIACQEHVQKWLNAGVPRRALMKALDYYQKNQSKIKNKRYITVIDFGAHSSQKRMYVLDTQTGKVEKHHTSHGRGSETAPGVARRFTGKSESHATPPGFHLATETYFGKHGQSLRLDGLEQVNHSSRSRAVVIHGANYVTPEFITNVGRAGRSHGCPAVDPRVMSQLATKLKGGSLVYHYTPGA